MCATIVFGENRLRYSLRREEGTVTGTVLLRWDGGDPCMSLKCSGRSHIWTRNPGNFTRPISVCSADRFNYSEFHLHSFHPHGCHLRDYLASLPWVHLYYCNPTKVFERPSIFHHLTYAPSVSEYSYERLLSVSNSTVFDMTHGPSL